MKKTYAYIKYVAPPLNKHGSFDAAVATALCLGVTLNATEKDKYSYRQGELEYPEDRFHICEVFGRRHLVDREDKVQDLNALLEAGVICGRMYRRSGETVEFSRLDDLTSGRPAPVETGPELPKCPHCAGRSTVTAFVDCEDKESSGLRSMACPDCQGKGTVTKEYLERRAAGEAMRDDRLLRGASLRQEAQRRNLTAREMSDLEHGRLRVDGEVDRSQ